MFSSLDSNSALFFHQILFFYNHQFFYLLLLVTFFLLFFIYSVYSTYCYEILESKFIESNLNLLASRAIEAQLATPLKPLTALITGANSGIGLSLSEQLASRGVRVILACRNKQRGEEALLRIQSFAQKYLSNNKTSNSHIQPQHRLILLDVSEPSSVLKASSELLNDPTIGHIDFLILNAGIMNVSYYKWSVILHAFFTGAFRYFLITSRANATSSSFLQSSIDDIGACGAPSHFATHVLGHLLLVNELKPLLTSIASDSVSTTTTTTTTTTCREGRIIWTGSRSSVIPAQPLAMSQLEPPINLTSQSGFQKRLSNSHSQTQNEQAVEVYGQAKYAQDLINAALSRRLSNLCVVICPGFVDTELTPPFFKLAIPFFKVTRKYTPSMVFSGLRGCAPHVAMMIVDKPHLIDANKKWVLSCNKIIQATEGAPYLAIEEQEKMWQYCEQWLKIWKESVTMLSSSSKSSSSSSSLFNEAVDLDKIASSPLRIRKSSQVTRVIDNTIQQSTKEE